MGKYMKKCRGVGEVAAMEVTQVVGVRTRSRAAAAAAAAAAAEEEGEGEGEVEGYLELRSRRLAMATRTPRSTANSRSGGGGGGCPSRASKGTISRCSSNASSDAAGVHETTSAAAAAAAAAAAEEEEEEIKDGDARHAGSGEPEGCNDLESSVSYTECSRERRRETTPLSELRDAESEQRRKRRRSDPSEAEIEEFFAAPERGEAERFATKYNFDVVNEVPLDGRYEWVRLSS